MNNERVRALLPPGSRVLCAVSGGSDSICLLHLLWSNRQDWGLEIFAAHYEHGLRGEDSLRDAAFVEAFCRERGIPCTVELTWQPEYTSFTSIERRYDDD